MHLKLQKLSEQAVLHESEKQHMREEFGLQRAKMKELFLQKEGKAKSVIVDSVACFVNIYIFCVYHKKKKKKM